jgi:hypothetical protein
VGKFHHARSLAWVSSLAAAFENHFAGDIAIRVLTRYDDRHRAEFGLNELLYDISVVRVATVPAARRQVDLIYVKNVLWQVESEFARNSREAVFDFNKLVLGSAKNKLFIGPNVDDPDRFLGVLLPAAQACTGKVYAALVPHPDRWEQSDLAIRAHLLRQRRWVSLGAQP